MGHEGDDDDDGDGSQVLVRLGGALARANRNDDAAVAFFKAIKLMAESGESKKAFQARENFMVVVNRCASSTTTLGACHNADT
jgi:hypothetical protein